MSLCKCKTVVLDYQVIAERKEIRTWRQQGAVEGRVSREEAGKEKEIDSQERGVRRRETGDESEEEVDQTVSRSADEEKRRFVPSA